MISNRLERTLQHLCRHHPCTGSNSFRFDHPLETLLVIFLVLLAVVQPGVAQDRFGQSDARNRLGASEGTMQDGAWPNNWRFGSANNSSQWNLGVMGDSSETGFRVSQVTSGGAASRARLEPGDIILTVEGYQIGLIGGRLYDLADEVNRRADSTGAVRLLLQDGQTGRLASIRVQLDNQTQRLTGTLSAPMALPADAVVTVLIENLTRPQWAVRNGQQVINAGNQRNIPFQIAYDPQYVFAQDIYQVRAYVSSNGRNVYYTPQPVRVITHGNQSQVTLRLEDVAGGLQTGSPGPSGTLTGFGNYNQLDDEVTRLYKLYLGRAPTGAELAAARISASDLDSITQRLPLKLMASQEYFDLAQNNRDFWLTNVFGVIVGRQPSQAEVAQWKQRFSDLGFSRTELLRQLYAQAR